MTKLLPTFLDDLLIDHELAALIGTEADCAAMLRFELALAVAEAEVGLIPHQAANRIVEAARTFRPNLDLLRQGALRDGVVAPDLIRQLRSHVGEPQSSHMHMGATSQDVIDTALALKLRPALEVFESRLNAAISALDRLKADFGVEFLMGRTRMQAAIPITVGQRIAVWQGLLVRAVQALVEVRDRNLIISLAGAAGSSDKLRDAADEIRHRMAASLGLSVPDYVPHSARDRIAILGGWLSLVTGALGKMGQDIALMAQNEFGEIGLAGGGGSSAMAHKQNPVRAEILVTLARFNAVQLSGLHQSLVHEQERSGAAWTLEWMILPQMLNATGVALLHAGNQMASIARMGSPSRD